MFKKNDKVKHVNSGIIYVIKAVPDPYKLLEYCAEPYYEYAPLSSDPNKRQATWTRRQSEMEDGRFISVGKEDLKPCPMCGCKPDIVTIVDRENFTLPKYTVNCSCGLTLFNLKTGTRRGFALKDEARTAWNRRKKELVADTE